MEIKNVRLSFCCQEDWKSFKSIDERTRFCQSCKHQVVDFTNGTQSDFDLAMNSGKKVCGRFKRSQMNEAFLKLAAATVVAAASTALVNCTSEKSVEAQAPVQTIPFEPFDGELKGEVVLGMPAIPNKYDSTHLWVVPKIIPDSPKQKTGNQ
ncbi:MAG: hypothetical protein HY015_00375 [Bacteroidetes bacterium]|nr:hypothetical protein [Bacteroidota bacterium]MBI3481433.1 hypothetical protein [Bacteroidota bacterium]